MRKLRLPLPLFVLFAALALLLPAPAWARESIDFSEVVIYYYDSAWYTGGPTYPNMRLQYDDEWLVEGTDYYCTYIQDGTEDIEVQAPVEIGSYDIYFHPMGRFTGDDKWASFAVRDPYDIANSYSYTIVGNHDYDGQPYTPVPGSITVHDVVLYPNQQFVLDHYEMRQIDEDTGVSEWVPVDQPVEEGYYRGIIRGIDPYNGTNEFSFRIVNPYDITACNASTVTVFYTGSPLKPKVSIYDKKYRRLVEGKDFRIVGYRAFNDHDGQNLLSQIETPGSYDVLFEGIGSYYGESSVYVSVKDGYDIANASVFIPDAWYQNGFAYPDASINMGDLVLERGTEYSLSYTSEDGRTVETPDAPGQWTATFVGTNPYYNSISCSFKVLDAYDLANGYAYQRVNYLSSATNEPIYSVSFNKDYVPQANLTATYATKDGSPVSPSQFVNGQTYVATITGSAPYHGQVTMTFVAHDQTDLYGVSVSLSQRRFTETGSAIHPNLTVAFDGGSLVEGRDYTVTYQKWDVSNYTWLETPVEPIEPGSYRVVVTGVPGSGYTGTNDIRPSFSIAGKKLITQQSIVRPTETTAQYTGNAIDPEIKVLMDGTTLVRGRDYTVEFYSSSAVSYVSSMVEPGYYELYVTGLAPYTGSRVYAGSLTIYRGKIDLSTDASVYLDPNEYAYTGNPVLPQVKAYLNGNELSEGTDYTVSYESNPAPSTRGRHELNVTGIGKFTGVVTLSYTIQTSKDLSLAIVSGVTSGQDFEATGDVIKPSVSVQDGAGATLRENIDYTVSYECSYADGTPYVDSGLYQITITGMGSYSGSKRLNYHIVESRTDISSATVELSETSYAFDGSPKTPGVTVTLDGEVLPASAYEVSYDNNTNVGTATVTVTGTGEYKGTASATFQITEYVPQNYDELLDKLRSELTAAKAGAESALSAQQQAADRLAAAEEAFAEAGEEYEAAKADVDAKQQALTTATSERDTKQQELDAANAAVEANAADIAAAQGAVDAAVATEGEKQQAVGAANTAVSSAQSNVNAKQQAVDAEQARLDVLDERGSVGFFESKGSTLEASYLTDTTTVEDTTKTTFASHTNIGSPTDATALQNMLDALDWIDYCNAIRANEGLPALKVTDGMMASAQRNANFSTYYYNHAQVGGRMGIAERRWWSAGENLYLTNIGVEEAYEGWYDDEKAVWEKLLAEHPEAAQYWLKSSSVSSKYKVTVGHYFNIVNPSYTITGIGLNSGWQGAAIQQFAQDNGNCGTIYSVAEYRERLKAYFSTDALDAAKAELADAQSALASAQQAATQAQADYAAAQQATQDARDALAAEKAKTAGLKSAASSAQTALNTANTKVTAAQQAYDQAKAALDALDSDGSLSRLASELDQARAAKQAADQVLTEAQAPVNAAQARLDDAGNLADATVSGVVDKVYNGSALTQNLTVSKRFDGKDYQLSEDDHYTLTYASNTNAGTAKISVKGVDKQGAGRTWGSTQVAFTIDKINLSDAVVTAQDMVYNGQRCMPGATVTLAGKKLPSSAYAVSYADNVNAGVANVIITGRGNYKGATSGHFNVLPADLSTATVTPEYSSTTYTGEELEPAVTVTLSGATIPASEYTVSYTNNREIGTATVKVTGTHNYTGEAQGTFAIEEKVDPRIDISGGSVDRIPDQYYCERELKPQLTVRVNGRTLIAGTDYTAAYTDSTNAGTAHVTVTGMGNYKGSLSASFVIHYFTDVVELPVEQGGTPHWQHINWMAESGVSTGFRQGDYTHQFGGGKTIIRQDMAAFLYRMAGGDAMGYEPTDADKARFTDVNESTPHHKAIWWMGAMGVSKGYRQPDGTYTYGGELPVLRQDMAAFLRNLTKVMGGDASLRSGAANPFRDVNSSTPHHEAIVWMANAGVTTGFGEGDGTRTYRGDQMILRQDMAAFLHRLYDYIQRTK